MAMLPIINIITPKSREETTQPFILELIFNTLVNHFNDLMFTNDSERGKRELEVDARKDKQIPFNEIQCFCGVVWERYVPARHRVRFLVHENVIQFIT